MRVEPSGDPLAHLAIFGEAPGFEEQQEGRGFVGKSGRELWAGMTRFCNLTRDDFYISNIVKDGLPKNRDPKPEEVAAAMPEFLEELARLRPQVIVVTAGGFATRAMLGDVKMSDVHGIPHRTEICGREYLCMPIFHPAAGLHNKGYLAAFAYDLGRLAALLRGDLAPWAPTSRPTVVDALTGGPGASFWPRAKVVSLDTEGWETQLRGLSFSPDGKHGYVIRADDRSALRWFRSWIAGKTVVMHNGLHDIPVLRRMGVTITAFHDTQVLAYHEMMRTGSGVLEAESQNLGTLAYRELGMRLGELSDLPGVDFDTQTIPYSDAVLQYAGEDAIATWRLFRIYEQRGYLNSQPYQIDMGQVPLVEQMIANGIPFDTAATLDYYTEVLDKLDVVTGELKTTAARYGNRDFNPGSHDQVRELVTRRIGLHIRKRTKGGKASTNEKALADHRDHPFVQQLQVHRELVKLRGTYVQPLLEELQ